MKKLTALLLVAVMALAILPMAAFADGELVMGSWRNDDAELVQEMLNKYAEQSGMKITFAPTQSTQYNSQLRLQLDNKTGPDLWYSRSYSAGAELYNAGFNIDVTDLPGVKDNFLEAALEGWRASDGKEFAVPVAAVSHIVYYNKDLFAEHKLQIPQTFEEFLALCETLKTAGVTPLANGIKDEWDILECVYLGMLPNYVGGADSRALYEKGEKKMNDEMFVRSLEDFAKLVKYLPEAFEAIGNSDGPAMMATGQAAMFIDGSWTCASFERDYGMTNVGAFAIPAPEGFTPGMCMHADYGIAGNKDTKNKEDVMKFLTWVASVEGAQFIAKYTPAGFFPIINADAPVENALSNEIYKLKEGRVLDSRFIWNKLMDMYTPMRIDLDSICKGEAAPQDVANHWAELQAAALAK